MPEPIMLDIYREWEAAHVAPLKAEVQRLENIVLDMHDICTAARALIRRYDDFSAYDLIGEIDVEIETLRRML